MAELDRIFSNSQIVYLDPQGYPEDRIEYAIENMTRWIVSAMKSSTDMSGGVQIRLSIEPFKFPEPEDNES